MTWQDILNYNPLSTLLSSKDIYIEYFVKRDLLAIEKKPINYIWMSDEPQKILKKQLSDGSWRSHNKNREIYPLINYNLIETWKNFRFLIEKFEFNKKYPAIEKAAEFIFSCQTEEGDIRGFLANQYAMYYTGAIMALLIRAGYQNDSRIEKGFKWLLKMRQNDGGWVATPFQTLKLSGDKIRELTTVSKLPLKEHDKSKPFSHNWTGMILRAFAVHEAYRNSKETIHAANLLKSRFFKADCYSSYKHPDNWLRFHFPFWWNDLVAAMDTLSLIGISAEDKEIKKALNWFVNHQESNGLWKSSYSKIHKSSQKSKEQLWISLLICRILKRFYS